MSENILPRSTSNNPHVYVVLPAQSQSQLESHGQAQYSQITMNNEPVHQHFSLQSNPSTVHQVHSSMPSSQINSNTLNQSAQLAQTLEQINHFPPKQREVLVNSVLATVIKSTSELQGSLQNIVKLVNSILINQSSPTQSILLQQQSIDQQNVNCFNHQLPSIQQQSVLNLGLSSGLGPLSSGSFHANSSNVYNNESLPAGLTSQNNNPNIHALLQQLNNLIQKENSQSQHNGLNLSVQNNEANSLSAINSALSDVLLSSSTSPNSFNVNSPNQDYFALSSSTSSPQYSQNNFDQSVKMSPSVDSPCNNNVLSENKNLESSTSTIRSLLSNPSLQWKPSHPQSQSSYNNSNNFVTDCKSSTGCLVINEETVDKSKSHRAPPGSLLIANSANQEAAVSSADEQTESCSPHSSPCDSPRVSTWNSFTNVDTLWQDSDTQISTIRRCCNDLNLECNTNGGCNASCSDSVDDEGGLPGTSSTNSMPRVWRLASGNGSAVESGLSKHPDGESTVGLPPTKLRRSASSYDNNEENIIHKRCSAIRKKKFSQKSIERDGRVNAFLTDPDSDNKSPIQKPNAPKTLKRLSQINKGNNVRMASLQQQFPSSYGQIQLLVVTQPEEQHRARYMTEGSRGAIKDRSGNGHPEVQLIGWNSPFTMQLFLATDVGRVRPHGFYQSCKVFGKSSTPCNEIDCDGTNVIEIPCVPENSVTTISLDCVGILKLRNADVEHRVGPKGGKNKSVRARLVLRVSLSRHDGSHITLQTVSDPILCTQPIGSPEISRISLTNGSWKGGYDLFIIGKNFTKGTKVLFQEVQEGQGTPLWEAEGTIDSEYFQQNHLICEVPQFKCEIKIPITVEVIVQAAKRVSEPHYFSYLPESVSSADQSNNSQAYPEFVQIDCHQAASQVEESGIPLMIGSSSGQLTNTHSSNQLISTGASAKNSELDIAKSLFNPESEWSIEPSVANQNNWSVTHNDCSNSDWSVHHPTTSNPQNWSASQGLPVTSEQSWEEVVSNNMTSQTNSDNQQWNQSQEHHQVFSSQVVLPANSVDHIVVSGDLKVSSVNNSNSFSISEQLNHQTFANNLPNSLNHHQTVSDSPVTDDVSNWDTGLSTVSYEQMDWTKSTPENNHFITSDLDHPQLEFLNVIPEESSSLVKNEDLNTSNSAENPILSYADVSNYFDI